ncbi:MAG: hypothetical protein CMB11_08110 [Euryarchaeota archaeon]|nr:hypothetical protein [Euryarchaeota archaeon]|tara:strand:- start:672 stop:1127 length:456 start_codon:yes stop_codon:yes gene_type:complete
MDDLAQTVMDQLQADDGAHPTLLLATWKDYRTDYWDHLLVHPITKNGTTSYNVEKARHNVGHAVEDWHLGERWLPDKVCNFATSTQMAEFLMCNSRARHDPRHGDRPCLSLTVGPFGKDLFNQSPMEFFGAGPVKELIDMLGSMRPTVDEE